MILMVDFTDSLLSFANKLLCVIICILVNLRYRCFCKVYVWKLVFLCCVLTYNRWGREGNCMVYLLDFESVVHRVLILSLYFAAVSIFKSYL